MRRPFNALDVQILPGKNSDKQIDERVTEQLEEAIEPRSDRADDLTA